MSNVLLLYSRLKVIFLSFSREITSPSRPYNLTLVPIYNKNIGEACLGKIVDDHWECISEILENPYQISGLISDSEGIYSVIMVGDRSIIVERKKSKVKAEYVLLIIFIIAIMYI